MLKKGVYFIIIILIQVSCHNKPQNTSEIKTEESLQSEYGEENKEPTNVIKLSSDIKWGQLNPARGDNSPAAGDIWGDRTQKVPTGFLVKFKEGFSSPPHIHNVTYRAIVVSGKVHNDDPEAENMWMSPLSFWTQPKGKPHITSANGSENVAYVEIDKGPYLVKPTDKAFENNEQPINVDASNLVWLTNETSNWIATNSKANITYLWKNDQNKEQGVLVKLPVGFKGKLKSTGSVFHAIVLKGRLEYTLPKDTSSKTLEIGGYFGSTDTALHNIVSSTEECVLYIRTNETFKVIE